MAKKCIQIEGFTINECNDYGLNLCKCAGCLEEFDCDLCFKFGCINHAVEKEVK